MRYQHKRKRNIISSGEYFALDYLGRQDYAPIIEDESYPSYSPPIIDDVSTTWPSSESSYEAPSSNESSGYGSFGGGDFGGSGAGSDWSSSSDNSSSSDSSSYDSGSSDSGSSDCGGGDSGGGSSD